MNGYRPSCPTSLTPTTPFPAAALRVAEPLRAKVILQRHFMRTELVTTLKRQATELLWNIERDREPILITQHGMPSACLVDVESHELIQQRRRSLRASPAGNKPLPRVVHKGKLASRAGPASE